MTSIDLTSDASVASAEHSATPTTHTNTMPAAEQAAGDTYPHLSEAACRMAARSAQERVAYVHTDFVVRHPSLTDPYNYALLQLAGPRRTRAKGVLVTGDVGSGKTTLGKLLVSTLERDTNVAGRVLMISLTGARNTRTVYGRILQSLNGPTSQAQTTPDRELALMRLLHKVNCPLLVIDEVQDVLAASVREQRRVLDAIKFLMNEFGLPIVALGFGDEAERAFLTDAHLNARFRHFLIPRWKADNDLLDFVTLVLREFPLRRASTIRSAEGIAFLAKESAGSTDGVMTLLRTAAVHAIVSGEERITMSTLQLARTVPDLEGIVDDAAS